MTFHVGYRTRFWRDMLCKHLTLFYEIIVHNCFTLRVIWVNLINHWCGELPCRSFCAFFCSIGDGLYFGQPFWCRRHTQIRMVELLELCGDIPNSELCRIFLENKFFQLSFPGQSCSSVVIKIVFLKYECIINIVPIFLTTVVRFWSKQLGNPSLEALSVWRSRSFWPGCIRRLHCLPCQICQTNGTLYPELPRLSYERLMFLVRWTRQFLRNHPFTLSPLWTTLSFCIFAENLSALSDSSDRDPPTCRREPSYSWVSSLAQHLSYFWSSACYRDLHVFWNEIAMMSWVMTSHDLYTCVLALRVPDEFVIIREPLIWFPSLGVRTAPLNWDETLCSWMKAFVRFFDIQDITGSNFESVFSDISKNVVNISSAGRTSQFFPNCRAACNLGFSIVHCRCDPNWAFLDTDDSTSGHTLPDLHETSIFVHLSFNPRIFSSRRRRSCLSLVHLLQFSERCLPWSTCQ